MRIVILAVLSALIFSSISAQSIKKKPAPQGKPPAIKAESELHPTPSPIKATIQFTNGEIAKGLITDIDMTTIKLATSIGDIRISIAQVASIKFGDIPDGLKLPSGFSEQSYRAAQDALKVLTRMEAATTTGINRRDYSARLIDATGEIDNLLPEIEAGDFKKSVTAAMALYGEANTVWEYFSLGGHRWIGVTETVAKNLLEQFPELQEKRHGDSLYDLEVLPVIWSAASRETGKARGFLALEKP